MRPFPHDPLLVELDAKALRNLARYFREHAATAIARAKMLEHRERFERRLSREFHLSPHLDPGEQRTAERERRNLEIMRLAKRGWSNKEIAEKVGLKSAQSVSRIIKKNIDLDAARHVHDAISRTAAAPKAQ